MGGRHRKGRDHDRMDDTVVVAELTAAVGRHDPKSPGAGGGGFAERVLAAQPLIPAWIAWLVEHAGQPLARLEYQMHYPLDRTSDPDRRTSEAGLIIRRAYHAEVAARSVQRAHRFYRDHPGVLYAHTPALPDDTEFYAALESGQEWSGHWYSRDPIQAWEPSDTPA
ncbi:hypothetical protein [Nocardia gipuzkoensis]|uniref:hypothetical protein n=1 Tax=Nocardia gipuzkoensis TaxID=2749991 RepID=UPI00237E7C3A|nr:hypothetical protein [Nocardia gipuzkoensis]MDE1675146.1 hypothetical protein [Nocardia gipuzkoensis]